MSKITTTQFTQLKLAGKIAPHLNYRDCELTDTDWAALTKRNSGGNATFGQKPTTVFFRFKDDPETLRRKDFDDLDTADTWLSNFESDLLKWVLFND